MARAMEMATIGGAVEELLQPQPTVGEEAERGKGVLKRISRATCSIIM